MGAYIPLFPAANKFTRKMFSGTNKDAGNGGVEKGDGSGDAKRLTSYQVGRMNLMPRDARHQLNQIGLLDLFVMIRNLRGAVTGYLHNAH
jgi:hypothetical protein